MEIPENLYRKIQILMPIPCVDLMVSNMQGRVLMLKRKNPPVQGQWWFPGGRIIHGELREKAAIRKLKEECGLTPLKIQELGIYGLILNIPETSCIYHAITTVFYINVNEDNVLLDNQSYDYMWKDPTEWLDEVEHGFLKSLLSIYLLSK